MPRPTIVHEHVTVAVSGVIVDRYDLLIPVEGEYLHDLDD